MNLVDFLYLFQVLRAIRGFFLPQGNHQSNASQFSVSSLPDSPPLPLSWAGRLSVPGAQEGNEMFFWLFDAEDPAYDDHLIGSYGFVIADIHNRY